MKEKSDSVDSSDFQFKVFNGKLAQFKKWQNAPEAWEERWSRRSLESLLKYHANGELGEFEILTRYLPKGLPVLEAGCGMGQLVMALAARGYKVQGVDYSGEMIDKIKAAAPHLNVQVGDVYALDVPGGTYGGYISIGVFEHNPAGPMAGLREVRRVLHDQGVAFIAVPFLNRQRKKIQVRCSITNSPRLADGLNFYQYYYSAPEFKDLLSRAGLELIEAYPYGVYYGVTRDYPIGSWLDKKGFFFYRIQKNFSRICRHAPSWMRWYFAHMIMCICKPAT